MTRGFAAKNERARQNKKFGCAKATRGAANLTQQESCRRTPTCQNKLPSPKNELTAIAHVWPRFPLRDQVLFALMLSTGLRVSEALRLSVADVWDGTDVRATVIAGRSAPSAGRGTGRTLLCVRALPLPADLRVLLRRYVPTLRDERDAGASQPLFHSRRGTRLSKRQATLRLRQILLAAGLTSRTGYGWQAVRRSFATAVYGRSAGNAVLTGRLLGLRSLQTLGDYLPVADDAAVQAAILAVGCAATDSNRGGAR
jgi:site-specific recombinase XerD